MAPLLVLISCSYLLTVIYARHAISRCWVRLFHVVELPLSASAFNLDNNS